VLETYLRQFDEEHPLKRWLLRTHQGAVRPQHWEYYLDELTFRFNRRKSHHRSELFYRLMQQTVATETTPYHEIVAPKGEIPH